MGKKSRESVNDMRQNEIAQSGLGEALASDLLSHALNREKALIGQQKHMKSLEKMAARIIGQAEQMAKEIGQAEQIAEEIFQHAKEKAKAEAATTIAQSEKRAQEIMQEAKKKAMTEAAWRVIELDQEAHDVLEKAKRQAADIIDEARSKAEVEASEIIRQSDQNIQEMMEAAESKAEAEAAEIIAQSEKRAQEIMEEAKKQAEPEAAEIIAQSEQMAKEILEEARRKAEAEAAERVIQVEQEGRQAAEQAKREAEAEAAEIIAQSEQSAQEIAEHTKEKAEAEAAEIIAQSEKRAQEILEEAKGKAEAEAAQIIAQSEYRAKEVLEAARERDAESAKIITQSAHSIRKVLEEAEKALSVEAEEELVPTASIPMEEAVKTEDAEEELVPTASIPMEVMMKTERILIVDDDPPVQEMIQEILEREGYQVIAVGSGDEALAMAEANDFDLILADIKMPEMDGLELVKKFREVSPETIPMLITGYASIETARVAVREGFYDYIVKPFERSELCSAVAEALQRKRERDAEAAKIVTQSVHNIREVLDGVEKALSVEAEEELEPTASIPMEEAVKTEDAEEELVPTVETGHEQYQGRVELIVAPPVDFTQLREFEASLKSCPEVEVLARGGSADGLTRIAVKLEKAIPLSEILRDMPIVKRTLQQEHRIMVVLDGGNTILGGQ